MPATTAMPEMVRHMAAMSPTRPFHSTQRALKSGKQVNSSRKAASPRT